MTIGLYVCSGGIVDLRRLSVLASRPALVADEDGLCPICAWRTSTDTNPSLHCADGLPGPSLWPGLTSLAADQPGSVFRRCRIVSDSPRTGRMNARSLGSRTAGCCLAALSPRNAEELCVGPCAPRSSRRHWHGDCPVLSPSEGLVDRVRPERSCWIAVSAGGVRDVCDSDDRAPAVPVDSPGRLRGWCPRAPRKISRGPCPAFVRWSASHTGGECPCPP